MAKTRIYVVQPQHLIDGKVAPSRLIDASTSSQAVRHCAKSMFAISVATPKEVATLVRAGVELETARDEEEEQPTLPLPVTCMKCNEQYTIVEVDAPHVCKDQKDDTELPASGRGPENPPVRSRRRSGAPA